MNKSSELAVVQFIHPGGEHKVGRDGWTPWNQRSHRRKFMLLDGSCVDGHGRTHTGRLVAWGEWEAPSRLVTRVTPPSGNTRIRTGLPDAIVRRRHVMLWRSNSLGFAPDYRTRS